VPADHDRSREQAPDRRARCPACGASGRRVGEITLRSLVREARRDELGSLSEFAFCGAMGCELAYFAADGRTVRKSDVKVRIGVKEASSPRPLCYCFDYSAEDLEAEAGAGSGAIVQEITARCREGLDRCAETNPRGACCLGDVRRFAGVSGRSTLAAACCAEPKPGN